MSDGGKEEERYVTLITGGPMKYYNRRRVRKVFAEKEKLPAFEPITAEWFLTLINEIVLGRHRKRMTQINLARAVKTSQAEISRIETGQTNPTIELVNRFCSVLDLVIEIKVHQK